MNMHSLFTSELVDQIVSTAQHVAVFVLQSTVICAAGLLLAAVLKSRGPLVRSFLYRATLVAVVLAGLGGMMGLQLPIAAVRLPHVDPAGQALAWRVAPADPQEDLEASRPHNIRTTALSRTKPFEVLKQPTIVMDDAPTLIKLSHGQIGWMIFLILWLAGALRMLISTTMAHARLIRIRSTAQAIGTVPSHIRGASNKRPVPVVESKLVSSPFLAGVLRPTVFIPEGMQSQLTDTEFALILRHESAHLNRKDCDWRLLARLIGAVCWPNYLLWVLSAEIEHSDEECVDQLVIADGQSPKSYADCLLRIVETWLPAHQETVVGSTVVSSAAEVRQRIVGILAFRGVSNKVKSAAKFGFCVFFACSGIAAYALIVSEPDYGRPWNASRTYLSYFSVPGNGLPRQARELPLLRNDNQFTVLSKIALRAEGMPASVAKHRRAADINADIDSIHTDPAFRRLLYARSGRMLKSQANDWYAEYGLSMQFGRLFDRKWSGYWMTRALSDAPAVLAGRCQYVDGRPVAETTFAIILLYLSNDGTGGDSSTHQLSYYDVCMVTTDAQGRWFVPVYKYAVTILSAAPSENSARPGVTLQSYPVRIDSVGSRIGQSSFNQHPILPQSGLNIVQPYIAYSPIEWITNPPGAGLSPESPVEILISNIAVCWKPMERTNYYEVQMVSDWRYLSSGQTRLTKYAVPKSAVDEDLTWLNQLASEKRICRATVYAIDDSSTFAQSRTLYFRLKK